MKEKYESRFANEEIEITVLIAESCNGASVYEKKWLIPSIDYLAMLDNSTGKMIKEKGRLEWFIKREPDRKGWGYDFEPYGIYRFLVRKSVFVNTTYRIVKILEENVQNEDLIEYRKHFLKSVEINTPYGRFVLDRSMSWFEGAVELGGSDATVFLETDEENGETADGALQVFLKNKEDFETFDRKNKEYAAENLLVLANEWQESEEGEHEPITKEKFMELMDVSEMTVSPHGYITLYYNDGDMFWGHAIEITVEEDGTVSDANIAG